MRQKKNYSYFCQILYHSVKVVDNSQLCDFNLLKIKEIRK